MAPIREQFLDIAADTSPLINLGGPGGTTPGAGGGGGSAVGKRSTGGSGGPGGNINLDGQPAAASGAGGGGAGAVGEGAVAGEGGGGGEYVRVALGPAEGVHHLNFRVGKGGSEGPGEDTVVNLCTEDGHVIRSIVARGGIPGNPPWVPPASRKPTDEDLQGGLKVSGMIAAEIIRQRDGLWTMIEGGWDWVYAQTVPFRITLPLWVEIATGSIEPQTILDLVLVVVSPDGLQVHEQKIAVRVEHTAVRRSRFAAVLEFSGSNAGVWQVNVLAGTTVLGHFPIEVRVDA